MNFKLIFNDIVLILIVCFLQVHTVNSQKIDKEDFDLIETEIRQLLLDFNKEKLTQFNEYFNIDINSSENLTAALSSYKLEKESGENKYFILPFFILPDLNDNEDYIYVMIIAFKLLDTFNDRGSPQAEYFFVMSSKLKIQNEEVKPYATTILVPEKSINYWYLKTAPVYLKITSDFHKIYGFVPPPPPPSPISFKIPN